MPKSPPCLHGYVLKVTLKDTKPPIWRRLVVGGDLTLANLHSIIQAAMGWRDSHLHDFRINNRVYGEPSSDDWEPMIDESGVHLHQVLTREKQKCSYTYDFGDDWRHEILVEKLIPAAELPPQPKCLTGKRACPPEDVGGIPGFYGFVEAMTNPSHPEHEDYKEWYPKTFDPEACDIEAINSRLANCLTESRRTGARTKNKSAESVNEASLQAAIDEVCASFPQAELTPEYVQGITNDIAAAGWNIDLLQLLEEAVDALLDDDPEEYLKEVISEYLEYEEIEGDKETSAFASLFLRMHLGLDRLLLEYVQSMNNAKGMDPDIESRIKALAHALIAHSNLDPGVKFGILSSLCHSMAEFLLDAAGIKQKNVENSAKFEQLLKKRLTEDEQDLLDFLFQTGMGLEEGLKKLAGKNRKSGASGPPNPDQIQQLEEAVLHILVVIPMLLAFAASH